MPLDSQAFMNEWKGQTIDGIMCPHIQYTFISLTPLCVAVVEQVRDGTTLRVRLFLSDSVHQMANVTLAGVRSAKAATRQGEAAEPWGEEVVSTISLLLSYILIRFSRQNSLLNHVCYNVQSVYSYYHYQPLLHNPSQRPQKQRHLRPPACSLGLSCILRVISLSCW